LKIPKKETEVKTMKELKGWPFEDIKPLSGGPGPGPGNPD